MLKNYFKIAFRNLKRNKSYAFTTLIFLHFGAHDEHTIYKSCIGKPGKEFKNRITLTHPFSISVDGNERTE